MTNGFNDVAYNIALLSTLIQKVKKKEASLTEEERQQRKERIEKRRREQHIKACVNQGICPDCRSKLTRGKKDKKNDYKRSWNCKSCNSTFIR